MKNENIKKQIRSIRTKLLTALVLLLCLAGILVLVLLAGLFSSFDGTSRYQNAQLVKQCNDMCQDVLSGGRIVLDLGNTTTYCSRMSTAYVDENVSLWFDCKPDMDGNCVCVDFTYMMTNSSYWNWDRSWSLEQKAKGNCGLGIMVTWPKDGTPMFLENTTHGKVMCDNGTCTTRVCASTK